MRWKKLGRIFNPTEHNLGDNCTLFSQAPQTLVFDNFVRIYFSAREVEKDNKHLSRIRYVDYQKDLKKIIKIAQHQILPLGNLGCYDEHGVFPLNVVSNKDKIFGFIGGWNRRYSVMIDGAIGLAISNDKGETFKRIGDGPVLGPNPSEPFLIADPFVKIIDDVFHMWYIYGKSWEKYSENALPDRVYKIAHATSLDGIHWDRPGHFIIPEVLEEPESQALPTVFKHNNRYHMYFCYRYAAGFRNDPKRAYRIGYAWSDDLMNWNRDDSKSGINLSADGWDSEMICYPHIFEMDGKILMLYNGNNFGKEGFGIAELEM